MPFTSRPMYPITSKNDSVGTMLSSKLRVSITGYSRRLSDREFLLPPHSVTSLVLSSPPHNLAKYSTLGTIFLARLEVYVEGAGRDHLRHQGGLDFFGLVPPPRHRPSSASMLSKYSLIASKLSRERNSIGRLVATSLRLSPRLTVPLNCATHLHLQHQIGRLTIGVWYPLTRIASVTFTLVAGFALHATKKRAAYSAQSSSLYHTITSIVSLIDRAILSARFIYR